MTSWAELDRRLLEAASGMDPGAVLVFFMFTAAGGGLGLLTFLPFASMRSARPALARLCLAVLGTNLTVNAVKALVARVRPCDVGGLVDAAIVTCPGGDSFPSGHAGGIFALAAFLGARWPRTLWAAIPLATAVASSRVVLGVHYPTDVLAGAALGSLFGVACARLPAPGFIRRFWRPGQEAERRTESRSRGRSPSRADGSEMRG